MNRAIHIFPPMMIAQTIEPFRKRYDPLHSLIGPHITLVHPFESELSTLTLTEHIKNVLQDFTPFKVVLQGITGTNDGYLFLNVKVGNDQIIGLRDRLYNGPLKSFLNRKITNIPHLTIGQLHNESTFTKALIETEHFNETFEFWVNEVVVEEIEQSGKSAIESRISF